MWSGSAVQSQSAYFFDSAALASHAPHEWPTTLGSGFPQMV
jgi:hypothetical protein